MNFTFPRDVALAGAAVLSAAWRLRQRMGYQQPTPDAFDAWLEDGLRRGLEPVLLDMRQPAVPRYALLRRTGRAARVQRFIAGGTMALSFTALTAIGAAAATTGSLDASVWGRHVSQAVETCRRELAAGQHGLGPCVSAIANSKTNSEGPNAPAGEPQNGAGVPHSSGAGTSNPGHGGTPPGQGGVAPGPGATPPGQSGTAPGNSGSAPGHSSTAPGNSGSAPGHTGSNPGHGGTPPGQGSPKPKK